MAISFNQSFSSFYRKIINKYRKGRSNSFIFPVLIFKKNSENILNKKIKLNFLFTLHIHNLTYPLILKSIQSMKQVLLFQNNEKSTLESKITALPFQYANEIRKTLITMPSSILRKFQKTKDKSSDSVKETRIVEYTASALKQQFIPLKSVVSIKNTINYVSYPQTHWIKNYSEFYKKNIQVPMHVNKPLWRDKLLPNKNMILKVHGFQNNKIFPNRKIIDLPLMKFNNNVHVSEASASVKEEKSFNINAGNLHYRNKWQIEQEIEDIKKTMNETKESVKSMAMRPSGQEEVKTKVDINRISDLVYQNIERSIRMEKVRRGM